MPSRDAASEAVRSSGRDMLICLSTLTTLRKRSDLINMNKANPGLEGVVAAETLLSAVSAATTPSKPGFALFILIKSLLFRNVVNVDNHINMSRPELLTASEAASRLGISVPTLYAYVSRGLLRSEPGDSAKRTRLYSSEEIDRLRLKKEQRRDPARVAQ